MTANASIGVGQIGTGFDEQRPMIADDAVTEVRTTFVACRPYLRTRSTGAATVCFQPIGEKLALSGEETTARPDNEIRSLTGLPVGGLPLGPEQPFGSLSERLLSLSARVALTGCLGRLTFEWKICQSGSEGAARLLVGAVQSERNPK